MPITHQTEQTEQADPREQQEARYRTHADPGMAPSGSVQPGPVQSGPFQSGPFQSSPEGAAPPRGNTGGLIRRIGLAVVLLAAAVLGYFKFQANKAQRDQDTAKTVASAHRPTPVTVMPVVGRTMPIFLTALGTVTAYNTVTIKSRVDGELMSVNVREGQQVSKGQLRALVDPRPYQATLAQAIGQLAKDQAQADYAKAEAARYKALYDAGVVSKESQETQISTAGQSAGALDADRAAIEAARVNVAYTRITSPIDGVVGLRQVDAGNIVHAADTNGLLVVTQLQPIAVIFTLPEDQLPEVLKLVRGGHKLVAEAYDRSESTKLATGSLLTIDNEIDPTTGTVKAKAVFDNRDGALFPNQFVNIRLILEERPDAIVIPTAAIESGASGPFVYLLRDGMPPKRADDDQQDGAAATAQAKAARPAAGEDADPASKQPPHFVEVRNVQVDLTEGTLAILKGGLQPGEQVVTDGQEKLRNFARVTLPRSGTGTADGSHSRTGAAATGKLPTPIQPPATAAAHPHAAGAQQ
jgi:multidrug efflux system membrane fusion protein